jgi:hypothetical protein
VTDRRTFPCHAEIGSTDWGLDADHYEHRQEHAYPPDLTVTDPDVIGILWGPDGTAYRPVLDRDTVRFGFQPSGRVR